jgi:HAE1 family hydrophobic/amphiphilic exporter-1
MHRWLLHYRMSLFWVSVAFMLYCIRIFYSTPSSLLPPSTQSHIFFSVPEQAEGLASDPLLFSRALEFQLKKWNISGYPVVWNQKGWLTGQMSISQSLPPDFQTQFKAQWSLDYGEKIPIQINRKDSESFPVIKMVTIKEKSNTLTSQLMRDLLEKMDGIKGIKKIEVTGGYGNKKYGHPDFLSSVANQRWPLGLGTQSSNTPSKLNSFEPTQGLPKTDFRITSNPLPVIEYEKKVAIGPEETLIYYDQKPAYLIEIYKEKWAHEEVISAKIKEVLQNYTVLKPEIISDVSIYLAASQKNIIDNISDGILLSCVTILLAVRSFRSTLLIAIIIPISIVFCFPILSLFGITKNVMSLAGFALGVGAVADSGLSIITDIQDKVKSGVPALLSGWKTALENTRPNLSTTITNLCIFTPLFFASGRIGELFSDLLFSLVVAQVFSFLVSIFLLPSICVLTYDYWSPKVKKNSDNIVDEQINVKKESKLEYILKNPMWYTTIGLSSLILVTWSFTTMPHSEVLPQMRNSQLSAEIESLGNQDLSKENALDNVFVSIQKLGGKKIFAQITQKNMVVKFDYVGGDPNRRNMESEIEKSLVGVSAKVFPVSPIDPGAEAGKDVRFFLQSQSSTSLRDFLKELETLPGIYSIKTNYDRSQSNLTQNSNQLTSLSHRNGFEASQWMSHFYLPDPFSQSSDSSFQTHYKWDLFGSLYNTSTGAFSPKQDAVIVEKLKNEPLIQSVWQSQFRTFVEVGLINKSTTEIYKKIEDIAKGTGNSVHKDQETLESEKTLNELVLLGCLSVSLAFFVLWVQFKSTVYSFVSLFSFFLGFVGAFPALRVHGLYLDSGAIVGFVLLAGSIVNNGILLMEMIIKLRGKQLEPWKACLESIRSRFSNVMITSLTTVLSTLPLVYEKGEGGALYQGLSTIVVFGTLISTPMSLIAIPCLVMMANDIGEYISEASLRFRIWIFHSEKSLILRWIGVQNGQ